MEIQIKLLKVDLVELQWYLDVLKRNTDRKTILSKTIVREKRNQK